MSLCYRNIQNRASLREDNIAKGNYLSVYYHEKCEAKEAIATSYNQMFRC